MATAVPAPPLPELEAALHGLHEASFGWARSCCHGDPDDAADVLQTAYCKVLSGAATFSGRSSFRTWLFGIIRFTALEQRRRGVRELPFADIAEPESEQPAADDVIIEAERVAALRAALTSLPDRQREVLHLVFQQELSVAEAADAMGVSVGTARVHYDRGKKRLRVLLAGGDPDATDPSSDDER
jgi:RNA polymerase sigma factor (sigma-70 family)